MPKRFRLTILCLLAVVMVSTTPMTATRADVVISFPILAPIEGCFYITSGITSPSPGKFSFTNAFGTGDFFVSLRHAGEDGTFNFNLDNTSTPPKINGGTFQNDVNLLATNGSNIFGKLDSTSVTGPDAKGIIAVKGIMSIFGGTRTYNLAKGFALFTLTIYTQDITINGILFKANTAVFCLDGRILISPPIQICRW